MKFKEHQQRPLHQGKLGFANAHALYQTKSFWVKVFLDIDQNDVIKKMTYEHEGAYDLVVYLSALSSAIIDKPIYQVKHWSNEIFLDLFDEDETFLEVMGSFSFPVINLPLILIQSAIEYFEGNAMVTKAESKKARPEELICRCFGVYSDELYRTLVNKREYELKDLVKKTFATQACGTCHHDVLEIYEEARRNYPLIKADGVNIDLVSKKTTAEWVLSIDKALANYAQNYALGENKIEIIKFKYPELRLKLIKVNAQLDQDKLTESLTYFLNQSLGLEVKINWV